MDNKNIWVSLCLYVCLTWVEDSWAPLQWGRHRWCCCSQTHRGSVACGILCTGWPSLHLLFAETGTQDKWQTDEGRAQTVISLHPDPNICLTVQDCILMVVSSGQCFWRCFKAPSSSWNHSTNDFIHHLFLNRSDDAQIYMPLRNTHQQ